MLVLGIRWKWEGSSLAVAAKQPTVGFVQCTDEANSGERRGCQFRCSQGLIAAFHRPAVRKRS